VSAYSDGRLLRENAKEGGEQFGWRTYRDRGSAALHLVARGDLDAVRGLPWSRRGCWRELAARASV
jgi:hypothetical protein